MTIPDDFTANWHKMTREELAEHYNISTDSVTKICRELGLKRPHGAKVNVKRADAPNGFEKIMHLPESVLAKRLGCRQFDIRRWRRQHGYQPNPSHKVEPAQPVVFRDATLAARYLQKRGPISRCTAEGRMGRGDHWMRGNKVKTDAEVIELAVQLGWDADEWRRVEPIAHLNTIAQGGVA